LPVLLEPVQPPLWIAVTIICTVLFVLVIGLTTILTWMTDRADMLEAPEEFLEHVMGRNLDLEAFAPHRSSPEVLLDWLQGYEAGELLRDAIGAYEEFLDTSETEWTRLRRTLVIMLCEAQRLDEAAELLAEFETEFLDDPAEQAFVEACRSGYFGGDPADTLYEPSAESVAAMLHPAWARDRLVYRLTQAEGDATSAAAARERLEKRARKLHFQVLPLIWFPVVIISGAILILVFWVSLGAPKLRIGTGLVSSPWSLGRGAAVMVRAALSGVVVSESLGMLLAFWPGLSFLRGIASLAAILPLLWFGTRKLLRPWGLTVATCFGLSVPAHRWLKLLLFTVVLSGVDQLGSILISVVLDHFGIQMHWSESPQEDYLWQPWWLISLDFLDGVVWAPICEEIGCRGFLYTTVRRRFSAVPAALITALIFGAVHFYSISGFLAVAWSGFVWSIAYERSRSLIPGMISHSMDNLMAFGAMVLLYRL
jgi:membrane protease YdiL (CAAX protease family)